MTRTLSIHDTICAECLTSYDTVDEATECERLDLDDYAAQAELEAAEIEWDALTYGDEIGTNIHEFLISLHAVNFERP